MRIPRTFAGLKPESMCSSCQRLLMSRPEPISSITESASSETTSTLRSRYELRAAVNRRPCHTTVRTGPYTAVRELIPFLVDERRKTKRFEVGIGKPNREGFGACEIPRAKSAASGVTRQPSAAPSTNRAARRRRWVFHCRHKAARSRNLEPGWSSGPKL